MDLNMYTTPTLHTTRKPVRPVDPEAFAGLVDLWDVGVTAEQVATVTDLVRTRVGDVGARGLILSALGIS